MQRRALYPLFGMLASVGVPLSMLLVHALQARAVPTPSWILGDIGSARFAYFWLTFASATLLAAVGFVLGRKVDLASAKSLKQTSWLQVALSESRVVCPMESEPISAIRCVGCPRLIGWSLSTAHGEPGMVCRAKSTSGG